MMKVALANKLFAASYTADGLYHVLPKIIASNVTRLLRLQGADMKCTSSLLAEVGLELQGKSFTVEYYFCPLYPEVLEAIVIPSLKTGLINDSAAHIIGLSGLRIASEEIKLTQVSKNYVYPLRTLNNDAALAQAYQAAIYYLAEAKLTLEHLRLHRKTGIATIRHNRITLKLLERLLDDEPCMKESRQRHLLASAITPQGHRHYYDNLLAGCSELYLLSGSLGAGKSAVLDSVYQVLKLKGIALDIYHCALDPKKIDALIVPDKGVALVAVGPYQQLGRELCGVSHREEFNLDSEVDVSSWKKVLLQDYEDRFTNLLAKGISCLAKAHVDEANKEAHYVSVVDSKRQHLLKDKIIRKVLF